MKLLAEHIRAQSGADGINAFAFWHGGMYWRQPPPDEAEVVAGATIIAVHPRGIVRSWLEVLAPDLHTAPQLWAGINAFGKAIARVGGTFPLSGTFGHVTVAYETDETLVHDWWNELRRLATAAIAVGPGGTR